MHTERSPAEHVIDGANRRALIARIVDLEHADARAVVDHRELIEPFPCARNALEEFHVHLQSVARLRLLIPLPALRMRPILLIRRQPVQPVPHEDAMHGRHGHGQVMKALQIVGGLAWAEMVGLTQVQDLAHDLARCRSRRSMRRAGTVRQSGRPVRLKPSLLPVEGLP